MDREGPNDRPTRTRPGDGRHAASLTIADATAKGTAPIDYHAAKMPETNSPRSQSFACLPVHQVPLLRPLQWLALGWRDFTRVPGPGLLHGLVVAVAGLAALLVGQRSPSLLIGAFSAFVLVGPILATGLYELSRLLARGERPGLGAAVHAWRRGTPPLVALGLLLGTAGSAWVLLSAGLFALFVGEPITGIADFLRYAVRVQGHGAFLLWLASGGLLAAVVFATTVVSPPLLLGRVVGLKCAILTSVRAVGENPAAMALWAFLIMVATIVSMATLMAGFLLAIPILGHATWHAYRDLVDTSAAALRY